MSYAEHTIENPSILKRFSHSRRFDMALKLLAVEGNDSILDYGTGDGFMLKRLLSKSPRSIVGYEPMDGHYRQLKEFISKQRIDDIVSITNELNDIEACRFDKVCCLEVLEHLTENNQLLALRSIKRALKGQGLVVVSVPIETGLSGLMKNLVRLLLGQAHQNTNAVTLFKSFFRMKIERGQDAFISSHIGFDYHDVEKAIVRAGYRIKKRCFSPLAWLGGFLNAQVFYVLEPESSNE